MKATGIVRRIDNLGRLVIPREVRKSLLIREGDSLEIFVGSEGEIILQKFSYIKKLSDFAAKYAESLHESVGHIACIADRDQIIAVSGRPKKEFLHKNIGEAVKKIMEERRAVLINKNGGRNCCTIFAEEGNRYAAEVIAPIMVEGDPIGAVILASGEPNARFGDLELKSAVTAASFLSKQMEQ
ncbi:MAG: stage V sporulation protein T [Firmicutes bacterium]|mgnify:CR=1 FL=1|nr:stage V sporulation protein T [Bacillota bacterium]